MNPTTEPCTCDGESAWGTVTVRTANVTVTRFNCDECDGMTSEQIETWISAGVPWHKRRETGVPPLVTEMVYPPSLEGDRPVSYGW